ncbi:SAM-dependent methyltransferase [Lewinellaceae bacterium SD302]|nr:SAM-dependent methyltransferase [Lewinellaceae bacterium SD302]
MNYLKHNKDHWNQRTDAHFNSDFYNVTDWLNGNNDNLREIERSLLVDELKGSKLIHFQCHFGQDTLSLARMGAEVTGVDLSDRAVEKARELAKKADLDARFICCDLFNLKGHLPAAEAGTFDTVFTTYGTIGWLPELETWAELIDYCLKPGGSFVFAEFHPFIWTLDEQRKEFEYSYFNRQAIVEETTGSYTDGSETVQGIEVGWNHSIGEVMSALLGRGLQLEFFQEYDYSPWDCFHDTVETGKHQYQFKGLEGKLPISYGLRMRKPRAK